MQSACKQNNYKLVDDLLQKMTLEEKIGQLNLLVDGDVDTGDTKSNDVSRQVSRGNVGGVFGLFDLNRIEALQKCAVEETRLGIPLVFGLDIIHGHRTIFPIPLALSCSWDLELVESVARASAVEAAADGLHWAFSPMVDVSRDPRWGRVAEGAGEDSYLGAQIAKAMVRGLQGEDLKSDVTLLACVKHLGLYGAAEAGRDYNTVDMSPIRMYEEYFSPYKAAIAAGAGSVMTSFNDINGIPATASKMLFENILRGEWKFDGLVVTDYTAISELIHHGLGDLSTVSAAALNAGVDMDMVSEGFLSTLKKSYEDDMVQMTSIDTACRRVLEMKEKLGLFEDPYRYINPDKAEKKEWLEGSITLAQRSCSESCALLKNENNVLPLKKGTRVALIGPLADDQRNMLGMWNIAGDWQESYTIYNAMQRIVSDRSLIKYAKGSNITDDPELVDRLNFNGENVIIDKRTPSELLDEALSIAQDSDVILVAVGEAQEMSGECASRADIGLPDCQKKLLKELRKLEKTIVLITFSGRPLTLTWEDENVDAILHVWFGGTMAGAGIVDLLYGNVNPSGKLTMSFPRHVGQVPIYYNHKRTGRPLSSGARFEKFRSCYLDVPNTPLYPFGYGLSYTSFAYAEPILSSHSLYGDDDILTVSIDIKNTGTVVGKEIVQLYITDPVASVTRPVRSLKAFEKIDLNPGEKKRVEFKITTEDLKFYNEALSFDWEEGEFVIHIGRSSQDTISNKIMWLKQ